MLDINPITLIVKVQEGKDLAAKDSNGFSDPYCIVELGSVKCKTKIIKKTLNPMWEETFRFILPIPPPLTLKFTLWDHDTLGKDFLGVCHLPIETLNQPPILDFHDHVLPLQSRKAQETVSGSLKVSCQLQGQESEIQRLFSSIELGSKLAQKRQSISAPSICNEIGTVSSNDEILGVISIEIVSAQNLPALRNATKTTFDMDPFVVTTFGEVSYRTKTIRHHLNPVWNQKLIFPVPKQAKKDWPIRFSLYDQDKFSANDFIGSVELPWDELPAEMVPMVLPLTLSTEYSKIKNEYQSALTVQARFQSMEIIRQRFWTHLIKEFDSTPDDDAVAVEVIESVLESIGSVSDELIEEGYAALGKQTTDLLTRAEAVRFFEICLNAHRNDNALVTLGRCPYCNDKLSDQKATDIILHVASCDGIDQSDQLMMSGFIGEAHTSRNFLTKIVQRVSRGTYSVGADSGNILVINRETGQIVEERIPTYIRVGIRALYRGILSPVTLRRIRRMLESVTIKQGRKYSDPRSKNQIGAFIRYHGLNVEEILDPLDSFSNFNEFFYRKLKPNARSLSSPDPKVAVAAADSRMMAFPTISAAQELWIKGKNFKVAGLLDSESDADRYKEGTLLIFRLAPQDYHRFHHAVDGKILSRKQLAGDYFTVNPMAIRSTIDVYLQNKRSVTFIDSPEFGHVAYIAIGAMMVGSIIHTTEIGQLVQRMDEEGYFAFGGSTIIMLFEPGRIVLDSDLVANSERKIETLVRVGMSVGKKP